MNTTEAIQKEFKLRVFDESYSRIQKCLSMLSQEEIWKAPNDNTVSVGCLVKHLLGNMQQWVYAGVLSQPFQRNRDAEFIPESHLSAEDLKNQMSVAKEKIEKVLPTLSEELLSRELVIQGFDTTGFSAIVHVIEHFSYHTGQISLLTKLFLNRDLGYYENLNLDL